jgi:hypothetical protein
MNDQQTTGEKPMSIRCPICNGVNGIETSVADIEQDGSRLHLRECPDCGQSWTWREPAAREDRYIVSDIVGKLSPYVPGALLWYAKQDSGPDDWCIAIGKGAACFTLDDRARRMEDDFIRELAEQILGYPPDSVQDLERRRKEAMERISEHAYAIKNHEAQREYWFRVLRDVSSKAVALEQSANRLVGDGGM